MPLKCKGPALVRDDHDFLLRTDAREGQDRFACVDEQANQSPLRRMAKIGRNLADAPARRDHNHQGRIHHQVTG